MFWVLGVALPLSSQLLGGCWRWLSDGPYSCMHIFTLCAASQGDSLYGCSACVHRRAYSNRQVYLHGGLVGLGRLPPHWAPSHRPIPGVIEPSSSCWGLKGYMVNHPYSRFAEYILRGLSEGFQIGFHCTLQTRPSCRNMKSAGVNKLVVSGYITKEMQQRWLLCFPVSSPWSECVHLSPFSVIPKKGGNKWKLKVNLSSPHGASIHDGIDSAFTSICYSSIDDAVRIIQSLGNGTLMAKLDLKAVYRLVPVHLEDRLLLGTWWEESIFVDTSLPFGLNLHNDRRN